MSDGGCLVLVLGAIMYHSKYVFPDAPSGRGTCAGAALNLLNGALFGFPELQPINQLVGSWSSQRTVSLVALQALKRLELISPQWVSSTVSLLARNAGLDPCSFFQGPCLSRHRTLAPGSASSQKGPYAFPKKERRFTVVQRYSNLWNCESDISRTVIAHQVCRISRLSPLFSFSQESSGCGILESQAHSFA